MTRSRLTLGLAALVAVTCAARADAQPSRPIPAGSRPTPPVSAPVRPATPPVASTARPGTASATPPRPSGGRVDNYDFGYTVKPSPKPTPPPTPPPPATTRPTGPAPAIPPRVPAPTVPVWKPATPPPPPPVTIARPIAPPPPVVTVWKPAAPPPVRTVAVATTPTGAWRPSGLAPQPVVAAPAKWQPKGGLALTGPDNARLKALKDSLPPGSPAAVAIDKVLAGELLTPADRAALEALAASFPPGTNPIWAGTIASALQADAEEKRRLDALAAQQAGGQAAVVVPDPVVVVPEPVVVGPVVVRPVPQPEPPVPQPEPPVPAAELGLVITQAPTGPGAAAGLRQNDLILMVGGVRTQSRDDLDRVAGANTGRELVVVYLDGQTGQERQARVTPQAGGIGVVVEPVAFR